MKGAARRAAPTRPAAERTWRLIVELVMESRGAWRRKVTEATDLPFSRVRALWRLERGPRTLRELAEDMGTDAPATTVIVDALEARGLVKRAPHPGDRRAKDVSLTAAGRRMLHLVDDLADPPPAALSALPRDELERLWQTLRKIV